MSPSVSEQDHDTLHIWTYISGLRSEEVSGNVIGTIVKLSTLLDHGGISRKGEEVSMSSGQRKDPSLLRVTEESVEMNGEGVSQSGNRQSEEITLPPEEKLSLVSQVSE